MRVIWSRRAIRHLVALREYIQKDSEQNAAEAAKRILIAVDLVAAAKAGDAAKQADADKRWHANAEDIAEFLSKANPNWTKAALLDMLNKHLALTTNEAVARLKQNWTDDVAAFDGIFTQAMMMADALTDGIAKQFPTKVS